MTKFAIVGFGNAGIQCLEAIRETKCDAQVVIFAGGDSAPASNPMLTTYYADNRIEKDGMYPYGNANALVEKYNAEIRFETVCGIDSNAKKLITNKGTSESFDKILIATGATPFVPIKGEVSENKLFTMRTPGDAESLKDRLSVIPKTAIVAGGSMVGIKVCEVLSKLGTKVTLVDMAEKIFPLAAISEVADAIMQKLESKGIELKFGKAIDTIEDDSEGVVVKFQDGSVQKVDILCACIGTKTRTDFIEGSGIELGKGILVDETMQTSVEGIYAAGDCVCMRGDNASIGLWANAAYQGRTAGLNMAGTPAKFSGNIPHNITHFMDVDFIGIGDPKAKGEVIDIGIKNCKDLYRAIVDGEQIKCVNILGNVRGGGLVRNILTAKIRGLSVEVTPEIQGMLAMQGFSDKFIALLKKG